MQMSKFQRLLMLDMFMFARLCVPEANDWRCSIDVNCQFIGYTRKRFSGISTALSLPSPTRFSRFSRPALPRPFPTVLEPETGYLSISLILDSQTSEIVRGPFASLPLAEESEGIANDLGQGTVEPRSTDTRLIRTPRYFG